ncbi:MAG: hypothetical protein ACO3RB_03650 [Ilumatobacteraceae bacterium]
MSRRIEIELTSERPDGTWTWRAAGAREPRGVLDSSLVPSGTRVSDVVRADVEADLDGTRVLSILPPKAKTERTGLLEILPSNKPFEPVTQQLKRKERREGGRDGARGKRRGDGPRGDRPDRPRRAFTEPPPELPQRPKPKRVKPQRVNLDAVLAELPEAHRAIAEKVIAGGVPAVRTAIEEQNKKNVAEGLEKIPADGLLTIAENLLPRLRVAEWRDRAVAAEKIIDDVDIRDLRQIVVASGQLVALDEETRQLAARMSQALTVRQEIDTKNWLDDIAAATKVGRVVRALRMSSQPPKAGVPFPAGLAAELTAAASAGLTPDAPAERWSALLEAAAFSPVRAQVTAAGTPNPAPEAIIATVTRLAPLMPQIAALFGISVPPGAKAPRPLQTQRPDKDARKKSGASSSRGKAADKGRSGGQGKKDGQTAASPSSDTPQADVATGDAPAAVEAPSEVVEP